jgi:hypothetical protein
MYDRSYCYQSSNGNQFKYIGGINDYFFGHFLFVANLGFAMGSAFGMYDLCSLQLDVMVFTSEWIETEAVTKIFWPVFLLVTFFVTGISGIVLTIKKNVEKRKDEQILNNICVNLDLKCDSIGKINNIRFNQPILNNIEAFAIGLTAIGSIVLLLILGWIQSRSFIWFYLATCFVVKIVWPCIGLLRTNGFNVFLWRNLHDMQSYCHIIVKGLTRCMGTETNTSPIDINYLAKVNTMDDPTVGQFLQETADTPEDVRVITRNKTQKVTGSTYVPVDEINTITISPTNPIVAKFCKEMTPIENADNRILVETSADKFVSIKEITRSVEETQTNDRLKDINVVVEVNAIPMVPACPKEGQYFQEMPSLEDTND